MKWKLEDMMTNEESCFTICTLMAIRSQQAPLPA